MSNKFRGHLYLILLLSLLPPPKEGGNRIGVVIMLTCAVAAGSGGLRAAALGGFRQGNLGELVILSTITELLAIVPCRFKIELSMCTF